MRTSPPPPDIAVEVGYEDGEYTTAIHFNKLKRSQHLLGGPTMDTFLDLLRRSVNGTNALVLPAPGRTSSDLINYQPVDIVVRNMECCPVEDDELTAITEAMVAIEAEWFDLANPGVAG